MERLPRQSYTKEYREQAVKLGYVALAGVRRIASHPGLLTMQQITQHLRIVYVSRRGHHRMHALGLAIRADMRLHAEYHWLPFLV